MIVPWRCEICHRLHGRYEATCHHCGGVLSLLPASTAPPDHGVPLGAGDHDGDLRIKTRLEPFDKLIGGGLIPGKVVVIFGMKGCGKSTLGLQIAGGTDASSLYVATEWSARDATTRFVLLGLPVRQDHLIVAEDDVDALCERVRTDEPEVLVVDSWHLLHSTRCSGTRTDRLAHALAQLSAACTDTGAACVLIARCRKDGEFLGHNDLLHAVSGAVLRLRRYGKRPNRRELVVDKTRMGSDGSVRLVMEREGLRAVRMRAPPPPPTPLRSV
jgi:DNA repair protein RadA/Sms